MGSPSLVVFMAACAWIICVQSFVPSHCNIGTPTRKLTIVMDGKTRILRDRMKSVRNTKRITEAMRLVAAARVRRAQEAVLRTRPLIAQLQQVLLNYSFALPYIMN